MSEPITTAMILAAGRGTRMRAHADAPPKPLVEIAGQSLLTRMIDRLQAAGIEIADLDTRGAELENVFLKLTGEH